MSALRDGIEFIYPTALIASFCWESRNLPQTIRGFMAHYHRERNHQGLRNELIETSPTVEASDCRIRRRPRLGGLLNYYARAA